MKRVPSLHVEDTSPRRIRLVAHGKAGQSEPLHIVVGGLRDQGVDVEVRLTFEMGDAHRFAAEAARDGRDVFAMGGDGTLHEAVGGLCDSAGDGGEIRVALGILPAGTGNDFANATGLATDDLAVAAQQALESPRRRIDLLKVEIAEAGQEPTTHRLLNVATAGLGASVTADAPETAKRWLGNLAYLIAGVQRARELEAQEIAILGEAADGTEYSWRGPAFGVAVGNGQRAGGGARLCPRALLDDGLLDLVICPEMPFEHLLPVVGHTLVGELLRRAETPLSTDGPAGDGPPQLEYRQLRRVEIDCLGQRTPINLDGEPFHGTTFRLEVEPRRLPILLPSTCPLFVSVQSG